VLVSPRHHCFSRKKVSQKLATTRSVTVGSAATPEPPACPPRRIEPRRAEAGPDEPLAMGTPVLSGNGLGSGTIAGEDATDEEAERTEDGVWPCGRALPSAAAFFSRAYARRSACVASANRLRTTSLSGLLSGGARAFE
jgi:hypothetical protein